MTVATSTIGSEPTPRELERIAAVLGTAVHIPYAPPHVYPMSAPAFVSSPEAERHRPAGNHLGLYVHIPFCNYACNFCFYAKKVGDQRPDMERYVRALRRELEWVQPATFLTQLFMGGGTPTALPADLLDDVLAAIFERFQPQGSDIHTVESSPESVTADHLAVLDRWGIGRVSMGVQTLNEQVLDRVNRRHGAAEALEACDRLVASGRLVNIDLIYGLPGQSQEMFRRDFETLAARGIHSLTAYNLRINERTPVVQEIGAGEQLDLARLVSWRVFVQRTAAELGFVPKTWHTFERPGAASRFQDRTGKGDQFGIGQSARSRLGEVVYRNHASLPVYLERIESGKSPVEEVFQLGEEARKIRFVGQSLGVGKPLERRAYAQTFGCAFDDDFAEPLGRLASADLVADTGDAVSLTPTGRLVYDFVTLAFYPRRIQNWLGERHVAAQARRKRVE
jgi:oxygen-independent coproporphyrinogen-3 oxidase